MKLEIEVGKLSTEVLDWYDNGSKNEISNALYHGYIVVTNPEYNKNVEKRETLDENLINKIDLLENQIEMYKNQIKESQEIYTKQIESIILETKNRYESQYTIILKDKEERIEEFRKSIIPQIISDKERIINEKNDRIEVQNKVESRLKSDLMKLQDRNSELESIMSNSSKKGAYAENKLNDLLSKNLSNELEVELSRTSKHSTDLQVKNREYNGVILVESKFYNEQYKKNIYDEIDKFYKDIDNCKMKMDVFSAIFVSYTCDIPGKTNNFICMNEMGIRCYYFANMTDEKFNLLYSVIELENIFYKQQKICEGNESMTNFLMRCFTEISENYKRIEGLSPGYSELRKAIDKEESKYNKSLKKIVNDIKMKSDTFTKLTNIDGINSVKVNDLLDVVSPHNLTVPDWSNFKEELVQYRVEKNELIKVQEERDNLGEKLKGIEVELLDRENVIKELEKKLARKTKRKKAEESRVN